MTGGPWTPVLPAPESAAVLDHVLSTARPHRVPRSVRPHLAAGGAGLALAYHQLDRCLPGRGSHTLAEGYLAAAAEGYRRIGASPGLFGGAAGLAFAAQVLSYDLPTVRERVVEETLERARALGDEPPEHAVDVIYGLAGAGAYLLGERHEPAADTALRQVLTTLSRGGHPPESGMAHGSAGPLALLSLALREGVAVPGQREAVRRLAGALTARCTTDPWGPTWPGTNHHPVRASWCRGGTGTARALWLAGTALDETALCDLAVRAVKAACRRPPEMRRVDQDPGLCHGMAGLLHITTRFAHDTRDPELAAFACELASTRLRPTEPGFLDGAAGVTLALLAAATDIEPTWDRALLLA
ncbi:lanthionine synthetase C family protein [Streptomyces sp. NPDC020719]|uniref:lanthionine synthetase C family protein n=1 Tax=unclassified Streptomyces TaxID=2593676 RepID=UPI0033EA58A6